MADISRNFRAAVPQMYRYSITGSSAGALRDESGISAPYTLLVPHQLLPSYTPPYIIHSLRNESAGLCRAAMEFKAVPMEPSQLNDTSQEKMYEEVDEIAQYADGDLPGLASFIGKTLRYPEKARKDGVQGSVFVTFVVGKDGSVSDVTTKKGVSTELDAESIRVA